MIREKLKAHSTSNHDGDSTDSVQSSSPPSRHEKWKQTCLKKSRTWNYDESLRVVNQIVSKNVSIV